MTKLAMVCAAVALAGCAGNAGDEVEGTNENGTLESTQQEIKGGAPATAYPESALLDMYVNGVRRAACSATLLAPRVVLTAGHCVVGFNGWRVTLPFAGNQTETSTSATVLDWKSDGTSRVNPSLHDVALVFLANPLHLASASAYPVLARTAVGSAEKIVNLGRIQSGVFSSTSLFVSAPMSVRSAAYVGFPYDYVATETIEPGDSGGADIVVGTAPHRVAAVNSGAGGSVEVLARTDLVATWIDAQVAAHGGYAH